MFKIPYETAVAEDLACLHLEKLLIDRSLGSEQALACLILSHTDLPNN